MKYKPLWTGFPKSAYEFPDRPAVYVAGHTISYDQLRHKALRYAATIQKHAPGYAPPLTAVYAYRTPTAFTGVLGSLLSGHGYVPLNRTFPLERTRTMLQLSGCRSMIVADQLMRRISTFVEKKTKSPRQSKKKPFYSSSQEK